MKNTFFHQLYLNHRSCASCASPVEVAQFFDEILGLLFADFAARKYADEADFDAHLSRLRQQLKHMLQPHVTGTPLDALVAAFFDGLPRLYDRLQQDVEAMFTGDPAAKSREEVIRTYPGFYAIAAYRMAHALYNFEVAGIPRIITEHAHSRTGIDIHPSARIGDYFCIDHGTGIVIGETTVIGNHVKIYQGVTLGALSVDKSDAEKKRHPTIEDHVVIYAGATILGGETTIGQHSTVGGNVWLTKSVPANSKIYYQSRMFFENSGSTDTIVFRS